MDANPSAPSGPAAPDHPSEVEPTFPPADGEGRVRAASIRRGAARLSLPAIPAWLTPQWIFNILVVLVLLPTAANTIGEAWSFFYHNASNRAGHAWRDAQCQASGDYEIAVGTAMSNGVATTTAEATANQGYQLEAAKAYAPIQAMIDSSSNPAAVRVDAGHGMKRRFWWGW